MNNKEILMVLGGSLSKDKEGEWHTAYGEIGDMFGKTNSRWRVEAARYLFTDTRKQIIVASGGKGQNKQLFGAPTISSVIKSELVELGVPPKSIIEEKESINTLDQLRQLVKIANIYKPKKVLIISSEWHLPRISAFIRKDHGLSIAFESINALLVSAEDVLIKNDSKKWLKIIETDRKSESYKKREDLEKKGVRDIEEGIYKGIDYAKIN